MHASWYPHHCRASCATSRASPRCSATSSPTPSSITTSRSESSRSASSSGMSAPHGFAQNVFYVRDNGIGIDAMFHEEIFRIFKRLNVEKDDQKAR